MRNFLVDSEKWLSDDAIRKLRDDYVKKWKYREGIYKKLWDQSNYEKMAEYNGNANRLAYYLDNIKETKPLSNTPLAPVTKTTNRTYTSQEKSLMASELSQRFSMNKDLISKRIEKNSPDFWEIAMALWKRDSDYIRNMQESIFSMAR